jgi:curved DNA-binding protein CbpA
MPRKKNPHSVKGLVDVRGRLAPTVGFRDYVFSKKPSVKRTANEMVRSISDYLFSEIGPGASGSTFGLDDRLTVPDISEGIKRENLNRVEGEERGVFGRRITLWEKDKIDEDIYHAMGDPYLVMILYRSISRFSKEVVDTLSESKVAATASFMLAPIQSERSEGFDPYTVLRVPPNASQESLGKAIRRRKKETHPDNFSMPSDQERGRKEFAKVLRAESMIGTRRARMIYDAQKPLDYSPIFMDSNIVAKWRSVSDVIEVAYAAQKTVFEMIDKGRDYTKLIEDLKATGGIGGAGARPSRESRFSSTYTENPKSKVSTSEKSRALLKTERLWERYCSSQKLDDLMKAYEALIDAKCKVTQYQHKKQVEQGIKMARAELKEHAK